MIIVRPEHAGTANVGSGPDGIPVPSGDNKVICEDCWGPIVSDEWSVRVSPNYSGESVNVVVFELIWDKMPCKNCRRGVAHTNIQNLALNAAGNTAWQNLVKRNPHRYAIIIGVTAVNPGAVTFNVVAG